MIRSAPEAAERGNNWHPDGSTGREKEKRTMADLNKVQQAVSAAETSGVRDLSVRQNGNVIEVHGTAPDLRAKQAAFHTITEKAGDASGVVNMIQVATEKPASQPQQTVNSSQPTGAGGMTSAAGNRTHTVKHGETLTHIAQHYYGKASEYTRIFEANRDKLSDPDKIREGMTLNIP
jgi:nucleoid-associated protein YgaU